MDNLTVFLTGISSPLGRSIFPILYASLPLANFICCYNSSYINSVLFHSNYPRATLVRLNLIEPIPQSLLTDGPTCLIHLSSISPRVDLPASAYDANTIMAFNIVDFLRQCPQPFFINCSSLSVYGQSTSPVELNPNILPSPDSPYGFSKFKSELIFADSDIPGFSLRLPAVLSSSPAPHFLTRISHSLLQNTSISLYNSSFIYNSFVSSVDVAQFFTYLSTNCLRYSSNFSFPLGAPPTYTLFYLVNYMKNRLKSTSDLNLFSSSQGSYIICNKLSSFFGYIASDPLHSLDFFIDNSILDS